MYLWLKALHIIAIIAWMAGMLYLPRLFVYHVAVPRGSPTSETFKIMERRLLKAIINPSMVVVFITGPLLAYMGDFWMDPWLQIKFVLALGLAAASMAISRVASGSSPRTPTRGRRSSSGSSTRFRRC